MHRNVAIVGTLVLSCGGVALAMVWPHGNTWERALAIVIWGLALAGLYYLLAGASVLAIFVRATLALFPIGGVTAMLIYVVLSYIDFTDGEDRAIIAAIVVAAGWVVAFVTTEWRRATDEQERRRDVIRAALTEIELIINLAEDVDWDKRIEDLREAFSRDGRYQIFVIYGDQFETFKRLAAQVEILKGAQIRPVLDFYQVLSRLAQMEEKFGTEDFAALSSERREAMVSHYLQMRKAIPEIGGRARAALRKGPFNGVLRNLK